MATFDRLFNKKRKNAKINAFLSPNNKCNSVSHSVSKAGNVMSSGGVIQVQIKRTQTINGEYAISLKRVSQKTKNSLGLFVAGGAEVDKLVDSANASLSFSKSNVAKKTRTYNYK